MRTILFFSAVALFVSSCSSPETKPTISPITMAYNNTEPDDWNNAYATKPTDNAHSGKTVAYVDSAVEFSLGYSKSMANISKTPIDSVVFSYWVFMKDNKAKAKTVLSIDKADKSKNLFWAGYLIDEKVKEYNKWMQVTESFKLPANMDPTSVLKLYVWNNSKEEILLDDFKVEFY